MPHTEKESEMVHAYIDGIVQLLSAFRIVTNTKQVPPQELKEMSLFAW